MNTKFIIVVFFLIIIISIFNKHDKIEEFYIFSKIGRGLGNVVGGVGKGVGNVVGGLGKGVVGGLGKGVGGVVGVLGVGVGVLDVQSIFSCYGIDEVVVVFVSFT